MSNDTIYMVVVDATLKPELKRLNIPNTILNVHFVRAPSAKHAKGMTLSLYDKPFHEALVRCMNATRLDQITEVLNGRPLWTYVRKAGDPKFPGQQGVETPDTQPFNSSSNIATQPSPQRKIETIGQVAPPKTEVVGNAQVVDDFVPEAGTHQEFVNTAEPSTSDPVPPVEEEIKMDSEGNLKITAKTLQDIIANAVKQATGGGTSAATTEASKKSVIAELEAKASLAARGVRKQVPIYDKEGRQIGTDTVLEVQDVFTGGIEGLSIGLDAEAHARMKANIQPSRFEIIGDH